MKGPYLYNNDSLIPHRIILVSRIEVDLFVSHHVSYTAPVSFKNAFLILALPRVPSSDPVQLTHPRQDRLAAFAWPMELESEPLAPVLS